MVARTRNSSVVFVCLFCFFCHSSSISFTRDELLNIRQHIPDNIFPGFDYSDVLLDILVGSTAVLFIQTQKRKTQQNR